MDGIPIPRNYGKEGSNAELSRRRNLRRFHTRWCMGRGKVEIGGPLDNVGNPEEPRSRFIVGGDRSTTLPMQFKPTLSRQKKTRGTTKTKKGGQLDHQTSFSGVRTRSRSIDCVCVCDLVNGYVVLQSFCGVILEHLKSSSAIL